MLSWRPVAGTKQFVRSDEQAWTKGMPEGSHRMKAAWLKNRYSWMKDGVPTTPGWKNMKAAKRLADMEEQEFCAGQNDRIKLKCLEEDFPANEGPDLGDWTLQEEADWDPIEDEGSFEVSAAYLERQAIEDCMRLQVDPVKARLMKDVEELVTAKADLQQKGPEEAVQRKANKRKLKEMNKAAVTLHMQRFKERLRGASVSEALASIPLRASKDPGGKTAGARGGKAGGR